jgi:predicted ribosome quality control (RQC) complex YloA/Tae2 family protein
LPGSVLPFPGMDDASIQEIVNEIAPLLIGRAPGKIFQFGPMAVAIDFGLRQRGLLFISVDPALPRLHLIKRRVRDLERQSTPLNQFGLALARELSHTTMLSIEKDSLDRVVRFHFDGQDELGEQKTATLIAQLTGRSANLFVTDEEQTIIQAARFTDNSGQRPGERYTPPAGEAKPQTTPTKLLDLIRSGDFSSPSEAADSYFTSLVTQREFESRASAARAQIRKRISQQQKLLKKLQSDLESYADADEHKRAGDLLLANLANANRKGNRVELIDYFSENAAPIELELDESTSLTEEAQRRFALYQRSKRALAQIASRIVEVEREIHKLQAEQLKLEDQLASADHPSDLTGLAESPVAHDSRGTDILSGLPPKRARGDAKRIPGTRRYLSSDGLEILVGRTSKDNDHLTLKIARPNDLWLHAADYGGSHVVIRNSTRKDVPHRTLIEAAQLAAYFSQAKKDPKVDVHYTQRKFVSKPKGAKPGLVRLQRFKNITVEPKEAVSRT